MTESMWPSEPPLLQLLDSREVRVHEELHDAPGDPPCQPEEGEMRSVGFGSLQAVISAAAKIKTHLLFWGNEIPSERSLILPHLPTWSS